MEIPQLLDSLWRIFLYQLINLSHQEADGWMQTTGKRSIKGLGYAIVVVIQVIGTANASVSHNHIR